MSVLLSSSSSTTNTHPSYFPPPPPHHHHINGNLSPTTKSISSINRLTSKLNENNNGNMENDHVPFGVVNSMKQRLLDKANESLLLNNNSTFNRYSLSKPPPSRLSSNENLFQTKSSISSLKHTTRLSYSQDNLLNNNNNNTEQFTSYLQPKQDVIIVERTKSTDENISTYRHSYTELHMDEVPKPGTVTTVKNMFERQIRLSRYDSDKLPNTLLPNNSRINNQHREILSPSRSRSISPNDMALRQRRATTIYSSNLPSTPLSLPVTTLYPDVVISHTPPTSMHIETNKIINEQSVLNIHNENKKKTFPLNIITDETTVNNNNNNNNNDNRPNLLLPTTSSSDTSDYQPLDFKSRLALFNRTNTIERSNVNSHVSTNIKKTSNHNNSVPSPPNFLTKPIVHHHYLEKKDISVDSIVHSVANSTKSVTFFGGLKINSNVQSTLPASIIPPPLLITKDEQSSISTSVDLLHAPDVIGGDVKLSKSSIFSGTKKDVRVQFIDNVDTFEYPSFTVVMAEFGNTDSDDDDNDDDDDENDLSIENDKNCMKKFPIDENINDQIDDVDDDELERLASINARFNSNNLNEEPLQSKGTLHTFRPAYIDQYELGTQNNSLTNSDSSDRFSREKYFSSSTNFSNHSTLKQEKSMFDMTNNIQWSSMSTTTDLLF
ncbi:unnamed protein product [Rotaria sordida]|uniref:Uncharacterized protein n=1 Tax=Rotaria sordida TaxID=392033 RepID=A0A815VKX6_9BILA|nr:unnamed protein product [Rotaria sordida]